MKKNIIVKKKEKRSFFKKYDITDENGFLCAYVSESESAVKKLIRDFPDTNFICNRDFFYEKKHLYDECRSDVLLDIFLKGFSSSLNKFRLTPPLGEICVMADPCYATSIINSVKKSSRLFTVVSPVESVGKMYDELYFKYGTVIRHLPEMRLNQAPDLVIDCDGAFKGSDVPCISFSGNAINSSDLISVRKSIIKNAAFSSVENALSSDVNAGICNLFNLVINENTEIDVINNAKDVFLLDTESL